MTDRRFLQKEKNTYMYYIIVVICMISSLFSEFVTYYTGLYRMAYLELSKLAAEGEKDTFHLENSIKMRLVLCNPLRNARFSHWYQNFQD